MTTSPLGTVVAQATNTDPVAQAIAWTMAAIAEYGVFIAAGLVVLWGLMLYRRSQTGEDPSIRMSSESSMGSLNVLVSGSMVSVVLALAILALTWPLPRENPVILIVIVGVVTIHKFAEWREAR
jgi:hypothetical protein